MDAVHATAVPAPPLPRATPAEPFEQTEMGRAHKAYGPIRSAARTASVSSTTTIFIAICSALAVAFSPDWPGIVMTAGLLSIGVVERIGSRQLRHARPGAIRLLMRNQLAFAGLICLYCVFQMASFSVQTVKDEALSPGLREQLAPMPQITTMIDADIERWAPLSYFCLYSVLMLAGLGCQGGLAFYYATRGKHLIRFHNATSLSTRHLLLKLLT